MSTRREAARPPRDWSVEDPHPAKRRRRRSESEQGRSGHNREDRKRQRRRHRKKRRREDSHRRRRSDRRSERKRRRRRHRSYSSSSSSSSSSDDSAAEPPRRSRRGPGVVSDDEEATKITTSRGNRKRSAADASSSSRRDDTVGHFRGGPGDLLTDRYRIVRQVGMGTFGRVLECIDQRRSRRTAIKVVRNVKRYYESALIEADIVDDVNRRGGRGLSHCAILFHAFQFKGHYCMVFERLGWSLYDFLKRHKYQPFPMICVRAFAQQLLEALEFLHSFRLIHTDLKPENILLLNHREVSYRGYQIPESTRIKVIDFGGATYDHEKKSSVVNTRQYRAPEVILGVGWSMPSDLWSLGCILAELYQGELLFATHDNLEHLALMERVIAPFPRRMLQKAKNSELANQAFDSSGRHRLERVLAPENASYVQKTPCLEAMIHQEDTRFLDLLRRILVIDPENRATAWECLRHRWW